MSLSKETLEKLEQARALQNVQLELEKSETFSKIIVVPNGFEIHNLEQFNEFKDRFTGQFETHNKKSFVSYAGLHTQADRSACFIDDDTMSALAIFDMGTTEEAEHCKDKAVLRMKKSASYEALLKVAGVDRYGDKQVLNQKQIIEFLEDWKANIAEVISSTDEAMTVPQAITSLRKMTIEKAASMTSEQGDFSESMSAMEKSEAKASGLMPAYIMFKTSPYIGLSQRDLIVRLSVLTGGPKIEVSLRINQHEAVKEEMAEEFQSILELDLESTEMPVYIGNF